MKAPSFQGTLHKYINGHVRSPSRSTAERIAKHFDIPTEAIYDEKVATQIAAERKLTHGHTPVKGQWQAAEPQAAGIAEAAGQYSKALTDEERRLVDELRLLKKEMPETHLHICGEISSIAKRLRYLDRIGLGGSSTEPVSSEHRLTDSPKSGAAAEAVLDGLDKPGRELLGEIAEVMRRRLLPGEQPLGGDSGWSSEKQKQAQQAAAPLPPKPRGRK
jgi:hypothetical protein